MAGEIERVKEVVDEFLMGKSDPHTATVGRADLRVVLDLLERAETYARGAAQAADSLQVSGDIEAHWGDVSEIRDEGRALVGDIRRARVLKAEGPE